MNTRRGLLLNRAVVWLVVLAMLLPGCATTKPRPTEVMLEGIVVNSQRLARSGETGLTRVVRDGATLEGYAGMVLKRGDRVETGPNAEAVIRYPSGSEVLMRPNSGGRIGSFTEAIGEIFVKVKGLFSVETTFVRAAANGTAYLVRAVYGGETTVIVFDGKVDVDSTTGAWATVTLGPGSMGLAHPNAPRPMPASADELQRTRDWVGRLEKLVPAQTGVSGKSVLAGLAVGALVLAILGSRESSSSAQQPPGSNLNGAANPSAPSRAESSPVSLGTPSNLQPGSEQKPGPIRKCTGNLTLQWGVVQGARDYVVSLESLPAGSGNWRKVNIVPSAATQVIVNGPKDLGNSNRWSVRARNGGDLGSVAPTVYFLCDFIDLR